MVKEKIEELYAKYREQIDAIASLPGMKFRKVARIVAWFYGGSEERWRKILASKKNKSKMPNEVHELLRTLGKRQSKTNR